jgi:sulfite reductase (NADPH) flavoprotein alpha-component
MSTVLRAEPSKYDMPYTTDGKQLLILFGTEYGYSEELAKRTFDLLEGLGIDGLQPRVVNMADHETVDLTKEQVRMRFRES